MTLRSERRNRRAAVTTILLGAVLGTTTPVAAGATTGAQPVSSSAVARELERIADTTPTADRATYDDSTATACRGVVPAAARAAAGTAPDPLAYTTNQVVLRTDADTTAARQAVAAALTDIGRGGAGIGRIETIRPLNLEGQPVITVLVVPLIATPPVDVVALARTLRKAPYDVPASPDYVLSPSSGPTELWPNGLPIPILTSTLTTPRAGAPGTGVTVAVYDTGVAPPAQSNNPPNLSRLTSGDREVVDADADGTVDVYFGGHTTAISGVLRVIAPGATVRAVRITDNVTGVATDVSAVRQMALTLGSTAPASWPAVIVNAFGSQACLVDEAVTNGPEMVPLGLEAVADAVDIVDRSVIVASAGNRGTSQRYYPAAFAPSRPSAVVSVGALDTTADPDGSPWTSKSRTGPPAVFSNFGPWVTAWAPGVALPVHHLQGLTFDPATLLIEGAALVDGTSFAGPVVAGMIAEMMVRQGVDADTAWTNIARSGSACTKANGSGRAVALTTLAAQAVTKPTLPRSPGDC